MRANIGSLVVLAAVAFLGIKGYSATREERATAIKTYHLSTAEATAYDSCHSALYRKALKNGGSKREFCGCFAKHATGKLTAEHKSVAGRFMGAMASHDASAAAAMLTPETFKGLASNQFEVLADISSGFQHCVAEVNAKCDRGDSECMTRLMAKAEQRRAAQR